MITDLKICEKDSGGDLLLVDNDLAVIEDNSNQPYLAMFGGNVEANTEPDVEGEIKENFDWWGNNLLFPQDELSQFNSNTERAFINNPLTSSGRVIIEQAVIVDTQFLEPESIDVSIPDVDKIEIIVTLNDEFDFKFEC